MFFSEKIKNIKPADKVLEIGPGGTPHVRADVFLEKKYETEAAWNSQRGLTPRRVTSKKVVYYDGGKFPFQDKEFDYIICSHVIEHVENVEFFVSELFRVASKGYIEYPTILYEYVYNFYVHLNFIKFKNDRLYYLKKEDTALAQFLPVQRLFHHSLKMGYSRNVENLRHVMFEGFEWQREFEVTSATSIDDLVPEIHEITKNESGVNYKTLASIWQKIRSFI